jgi:hypothetical protein
VTFFVYGLYDSGDWSLKYIGAASRLARPLCHRREARNLGNRTRKHRSIRKLCREGRHVGWKILDACDGTIEDLNVKVSYALEEK